jgi:hypothetical protein
LGPQILMMKCQHRNDGNDDPELPTHPVLLVAADAADDANDNTFQSICAIRGFGFVVTYIPPSNEPQRFARIRSYAMDDSRNLCACRDTSGAPGGGPSGSL